MHILTECRQFNGRRIEQEFPKTLLEILAPTPETIKRLFNFINSIELRQ